MTTIQRILHPTDFSDGARLAQGYAVDIAASFGAELHLLHTVAPQASAVTAELGGELPPDGPLAQRLRARLEEGLPDGVSATLSLRVGDPAEEIVACAEELGADMIVVGTRGLTGLRRLVLGSVAEAVLREAGCPVLVVRPPRAR